MTYKSSCSLVSRTIYSIYPGKQVTGHICQRAQGILSLIAVTNILLYALFCSHLLVNTVATESATTYKCLQQT